MTKIALITGGGSGIGRACALTLGSNGYQVVVTGRRLEALQETVGLVEGGNASAVACDVTNPEDVDALYDRIEAEHGHLDVLFNNAGNNVPAAAIGDIPVEDFLKVINVNLTGAFLCARGAFNVMRKQVPQGGRIINNGSISAVVPRPGSTPYTASKHAITGLTRTTSLDGRPYNIACGQIDIGNAASEMTAKMGGGVPQADLSIKPEPVMDVQHVADAVLHMANLPLTANIQFMTVMATAMPFIGRG
jgi:NAD(P)-dependent dehydrogenase (short-subunit alcohol dehydrogenase family)